jgi:hypothetical protein
MTIEKINAFAKEQGYICAKFSMEWNGYKCYEPIFDENEVSYVGLPLMIMVNDNEIRMSTPEEAMKMIGLID